MKFLKRKNILIFVALIIILIIGARFTIFHPKTVEKTSLIQKGDIKEELSLSGEVDSEEKATLQFQSGGLVSWVGIKEGDLVKKYQTIASLDTRQLRMGLQKSLNLYSKVRLDFDQLNQDLKDWQTISDADAREKAKRTLDKSQFDLNNSVIDVETQDLAIKLSTISTPISGIVTRVDTPFAGVNILPGQSLFEVVNPNALYFSVTADQTDVINLKVGDQAQIILDAYPDATLEGKIYKIAFTPKVGETGTVYEAKINIGKNTQDLKYRLGMTGDANFIIKENKDALYISPEFIKEDSGGKYILVGAKKEKVYIETGLEGADKTEIKGNIKDGDVVYD